MISVVIPVFKNTELFLANLKHNLPYLAGCEIIIVNDDPSESIRHDLKTFHIILIENDRNLGFGESVNRGVNKARGEFVLLLNSDVVVQDSSYKKALNFFKKNAALFAVSFAQIEKDGSTVGKNSFYWARGMFYHRKATDLTFGANGWAEGGSCLIHKKKFMQLSGFDNLYKPFYWEDIDLSYRAWKAGYEILFDSKVVMTHHHESTIGKYFSEDVIKTAAFRNQFIFIWKNITDPDLSFSHVALLFWNMVYYMLKSEFNFFKGFIRASFMLQKILAKKYVQQKQYIYKDREILKKFHE